MIETYGELILPKGFILYHTSDELFEMKLKVILYYSVYFILKNGN